ncbi:esterase-like activity of phytase-domain-containing protein [Thermothelomyces heterothallicus CBS 202.75]|uniref:esterase-like activity of phytase-domain-containing protein n=1 Tax=Thermothelomyces heterothallicus CBS 202.75 TaxID=1149848 RepID=UPI0037430ED6
MPSLRRLAVVGLASHAACTSIKYTTPPAASVICNGHSYTYQGLAGYGSLPSDARDQYGDTISFGSSMAIKNWTRTGNKYKGTMYGLPDRGWNTNGTQNTIPRVHVFELSLTETEATVSKPSGPNVEFKYQRTILLHGPDGKPMTGLDPDFAGGLTYPGFPTMPAATYPGDGFGGPGPGDKRISLDAEGLVVEEDGSFWISDEYGPFVYRFDEKGRMTAAIQPPDALLPIRNGNVSFNSNTPPIYDSSLVPSPEDPDHGRQNNQGFEGLTISADGKTLWAMLQSAAEQDGGASSSKRRNTRLLKYALRRTEKEKTKNKKKGGDVEVTYEAEYAVPLPTYENSKGKTRVAAQSEIHYVSDSQLLVLARDSDAGRGRDDPLSRYRHVDIVDISGATNIAGPRFDDIRNGNITVGGTSDPSDDLVDGISPAKLCPFIDYNLNSELNKFRTAEGDLVHNGEPVNLGLLNEKWEALALVPVIPDTKGKGEDKGGACGGKTDGDEYYLFTLSDNDFITNNGYADFGKIHYVDDSATVPFLNSQALVFRITLPRGSKPLIS